MESYRELRDRQQKEFNELPLGFAFSDKQFDEMMEKWGLDPEKDLDKIYRVPGGGFIQKKDHEHFHEVLDRHNVEMEAAKAADEDGTGFLYQMFKYELDNHEYGYTGDFEDALDSLGLTWEEVAASPRLLKALDKASSEIRKREVVDEGVADYFLNILPPRTMKMGYFQVGEPHSTAVNPKTKRYSETYATFLKVGKGMWEYRGHCFAGENMDVEQYKNIAVCQ